MKIELDDVMQIEIGGVRNVRGTFERDLTIFLRDSPPIHVRCCSEISGNLDVRVARFDPPLMVNDRVRVRGGTFTGYVESIGPGTTSLCVVADGDDRREFEINDLMRVP